MSSVTDRIDALASETAELAAETESRISDRENDPRPVCFWNMHNQAVMTREIVAFYENAWRGEEGTENEIMDRIMVSTRNLFVNCMSSAEKGARDCMRLLKDSPVRAKAAEKGGRMYLRDIIGASLELGYIDREDSDRWDRILLMRNLAVHNNAVSDRSGIFVLDGLKISMRPDRMMKGPPYTYVVLSSETAMLAYRWISSVCGRERWGRRSCGTASTAKIRAPGGGIRTYLCRARAEHWTWDAGTARLCRPFWARDSPSPGSISRPLR